MGFPALLIAAAAVFPLDVPLDVQIIQEAGRYVLRTNESAKSLYVYDRDQPEKSNCVERCAALWPPLRVSARARPVGGWTVIVGSDRTHQWALDGKPVYTYAHDADSRAMGDASDGVWHLLATLPAR